MHQRFLQCLGCNSLKADSQALLTSRFIVLFATPDTQCQVLRYLALSFGDQQPDSEIMISWSEWNLWYICVSFNRTALNASFSSLCLRPFLFLPPEQSGEEDMEDYSMDAVDRISLSCHYTVLTDYKELIFTITFITLIKVWFMSRKMAPPNTQHIMAKG